MYGCISTGKEANVYHAFRKRLAEDEIVIDKDSLAYSHPRINTIKGGTVYGSTEPMHYAVKVFKTSILIFKDRERYVEGEFRFRRGTHAKSNP